MPDAPKPRTVHQRHVRARSWQVTLILTLFFISVAGAAGIGWWYARESPPHGGPIVLITVDGLEASALDVPATGAGEVTASLSETPALAALARDAVIFDRAYIHSPELLPTHVSLLTGQLPYEHGVRDDAGFVMRPDTLTLPALLRNRGFRTGAAVSSFLLREATGVARGFLTYEEPDDTKTPDGLALVSEPGADVTTPDGVQRERSIDAAVTWAAAQQGHRYFLMLQVDAAHAEAAIDKVVSLLRERRLYDGSTIVLVGNRGKVDGTLDEQTLHVPLLVKQPQRERAGQHVKTTVQHIDVLPTILDLVRAPLPAGLRGRSLKPLLTETSGQIASQPVYSESLAAAYRFGGQPAFALTLNDFRYVRGDSDAIVRVAGAPAAAAAPMPAEVEDAATTSGELPPMRATLARMLKGHPLPRAMTVAPRDRNRLAAEGVLQGLQTIEEGAGLTQEQQDAIATTHREAARLLASGRLSQAIRTLEPVARTYPSLAAVHYQIGRIASELGRTADAIAAFQRAAEWRPDAPEVGRALALALLGAGRLPEAEAQINVTIDAATGVGAEIAASHDVATRVALAMNDADAALKHADAVQNATPSVPMRAFVQGQLLAMSGDMEEASRVLRGAVAMLRQHETALEGVQLSLGRTLATLNQQADAEAAFRAELNDFPRSVAAYSELVQLLHDMDRDEDAATVVVTLLAAAPTPEGYSTAARLWTLLGETARAAEVRSDARARFPWESVPPRLARVKSR